jgi:hypothetical protein
VVGDFSALMRGYLNSEQNLPSLCCTLAQKLSIKIVKLKNGI